MENNLATFITLMIPFLYTISVFVENFESSIPSAYTKFLTHHVFHVIQTCIPIHSMLFTNIQIMHMTYINSWDESANSVAGGVEFLMLSSFLVCRKGGFAVCNLLLQNPEGTKDNYSSSHRIIPEDWSCSQAVMGHPGVCSVVT